MIVGAPPTVTIEGRAYALKPLAELSKDELREVVDAASRARAAGGGHRDKLVSVGRELERLVAVIAPSIPRAIRRRLDRVALQRIVREWTAAYEGANW